jgi:SAM-dependent methyltransferase
VTEVVPQASADVREPFEFEPVNECLLCGSTEQHDAQGVSRMGVAFSYCYCGRCGLKYMRPRPTPACYQRFYADLYWQQIATADTFPTFQGADDARIDQKELRLRKFRRIYKHVRKDLLQHQKLNSQTRVLEVGCGYGVTLEMLAGEFGCQVFGIEPSTEALARCAEAGCISIVGHTAEEYLVDASDVPLHEKYDVILIRHCLENLLNPLRVLRGICEYLKDSGLLVIYTPNVEYSNLMNPYHPYLFSPETLSRMMTMAGFQVFHLRASPSPTDRRTALRVINPDYQMTAFARRGQACEVRVPQVDPIKLAEMHHLGRAAMAWGGLSALDMLQRQLRQVGQKAVRGCRRILGK